jgi:hypothetical protein
MLMRRAQALAYRVAPWLRPSEPTRGGDADGEPGVG